MGALTQQMRKRTTFGSRTPHIDIPTYLYIGAYPVRMYVSNNLLAISESGFIIAKCHIGVWLATTIILKGSRLLIVEVTLT